MEAKVSQKRDKENDQCFQHSSHKQCLCQGFHCTTEHEVLRIVGGNVSLYPKAPFMKENRIYLQNKFVHQFVHDVRHS